MEHVTAPRPIVEAGMAAVSDSEDFFFLACRLGEVRVIDLAASLCCDVSGASLAIAGRLLLSVPQSGPAEFMRDLAQIYALTIIGAGPTP